MNTPKVKFQSPADETLWIEQHYRLQFGKDMNDEEALRGADAYIRALQQRRAGEEIAT